MTNHPDNKLAKHIDKYNKILGFMLDDNSLSGSNHIKII